MSVAVWLKRDLRIDDHAPLAMAAALDRPAFALFVFEPAWLDSPECHPRHLAFTLECLAELRGRLAARGLPLLVRHGPMPQVLDELHRATPIEHLLSHEETGTGWSFGRDRAVAAWCRAQGVAWQEWPQTGVVRRLRSRSGWAGRWQRRMDAPVEPVPAGWRGALIDPGALPRPQALGLGPAGDGSRTGEATSRQPGGETAARAVLDSFLHGRGADYRRSLSSPLSAEDGCSRLSPHLAFGTLSMRRVHQATEARIAQARGSADPDERRLAGALRGFAGRLRWHCHFMQKLEDEPRLEFENLARHCDGLRDETPDAQRLQAWCRGQTGFPMVDACMRSLVASGWLNFRMRAMLVSFASYHLWLHWRATGLHLGRQFLDFEPGIHWSQMQMQSGTTGINTLRIYSPTKQALDQDPQGVFIRRWLPELAGVPLPLLATPWRMDVAEQRAAGCLIGEHYPAPVVDERSAMQAARERLYGARRSDAARAEAAAIQAKHGSRRSGLPRSGGPRRAGASPTRERRTAAPAAPSPQAELFTAEDHEA